MTLTTHRWSVQLAAEFGHADITPELAKLVRQSGLRDGVLTVQMLGSTGAITTIEYESGVVSDLRHALDLLGTGGGRVRSQRALGRRERILACALGAAQDEPVGASGGRRTDPRDVAAGGAINLDNRERVRELVAVIVGSGV